MQKELYLLALMTLPAFANAQNVGIGTTTPQATLDVKGNHRFGGNSAYMSFDTVSGKMIWWNSYLFAPVSQTLMKHSAAAEGLFYNNTTPVTGQLEYRNASGNPVFFTNFTNGHGYFSDRLGIGTTTPGANLHIKTLADEAIRLEGENPYLSIYTNNIYKGYVWKSPNSIELGSAAGSNLGVSLAPNGYQRVFAAPNGRVGIGSTTTPLRNLDVANPDTTRMLIASTSGFGAAGLEFGSDYGLANYWRPAYMITSDSGNFTGRLDFYTNGAGSSEKLGSVHGMSILNGKVGIGTPYPFVTLHVAGTSLLDGPAYMGPTSVGGGLSVSGKSYLQDSVRIGPVYGDPTALLSFASNSFLGGELIDLSYTSPTKRLGIGLLHNYLPPSHEVFQMYIPESRDEFAFGVGASLSMTEIFNIKGTGNVGIVNNGPNAPLAFQNAVGRKISLYESGANSQYGFGVAGAQLQIYSDAPGAKISFGYYSGGTFTEKMFLNNSTGVLNVNGTNYTSDARLKKDIVPLSNSLQKIIQLNGYTYHWKNDQLDKSLQTGVLAQEVQKLFPQLVTENKDGILAVNYTGLIPIMIESIKEQQKRIERLEKLVEQLTKK